MLGHLFGRVSERKLRLFACACCRRVWGNVTAPRSRAAVLAAERYADGLASAAERLAAYEAARKVRIPVERRRDHAAAWAAAYTAAASAAYGASNAATYVSRGRNGERAQQILLLRDIAGNPFRRGAVAPAWLRWNGGVVARLAEAVYEEQAFDRLPVLADALEEAGCTDVEILAHCRGPGPHVRGCWPLDLLLSRR
jgi:hypothetical protein